MLDRVRTGQQRVLNSLFSSARIVRLVEQEALDGAAAYRRSTSSPTCARASGARSTATAPVKVDAYRRNLQRAYVETLADRINGRLAAVDDARAFFRGELKTLDADLRRAPSRAPAIAPRRLHIEDIRNQIARALDHSVYEASAAGGGRGTTDLSDVAEVPDVNVDPEACWVDYAIRGRR